MFFLEIAFDQEAREPAPEPGITFHTLRVTQRYTWVASDFVSRAIFRRSRVEPSS